MTDALGRGIDAIVTVPISKKVLNLAGYACAGHTEMLVALTKGPGACMMLAHGNLRVSRVSTRIAITRVPKLVTRERQPWRFRKYFRNWKSLRASVRRHTMPLRVY